MRLATAARRARQWLTEHDANTAVHKLRHNWPITVIDLEELERIFVDNGVGTWTEVERAREMPGGFGLFGALKLTIEHMFE